MGKKKISLYIKCTARLIQKGKKEDDDEKKKKKPGVVVNIFFSDLSWPINISFVGVKETQGIFCVWIGILTKPYAQEINLNYKVL